MKKKFAMLLVLSMAIGILGGCSKEQTEFDKKIELGENYVFDAKEFFDCTDKEALEYQADLSTLDTKTAGTYDVKVIRDSKEYTIHYTVEDTKAPIVNLKQKFIFTNNVDKTDFSVLADVKEASNYTQKLCKFEKIDDVKVLDETQIKAYTDKLLDTKTKELLERPDDIMPEDGIYTGVYVVEDAYGHKTAKEVIVIYDTKAALISGLEELDLEIEVKDVNAEYTDNLLNKLTVTDAFDGIITVDKLNPSMTLKDAEKHIYNVKAEYTDRAGNKASVDYDITLKEKKNISNSGGGTSNGGTSSNNQNNTSTKPSTGGGGSTTTETNNSSNSGNTTTTQKGVEDMSGYMVRTEDVHPEVLKAMREVAAAGKYKLTVCSNGYIGVLVDEGDSQTGFEMILEYLNANNLGWEDMSGEWFDINTTVEWCYITPGDIYPLE